jgi:outer membrane protein insertion porin family
MYNLRGYKFREVGPYNGPYPGPGPDPGGAKPGTEPIGGRTYWFASAEYSIPIIERLRLAVFYDIGNVYPYSYSFETAPPVPHSYGLFSDNVGVGIRLNIPMLGPLRLDYAMPLTHDDYTGDSGRFQFGVGFTREDY